MTCPQLEVPLRKLLELTTETFLADWDDFSNESLVGLFEEKREAYLKSEPTNNGLALEKLLVLNRLGAEKISFIAKNPY